MLKNVFLVFKNEPGVSRTAREVVEKLSEMDKTAKPQPVRLAMNYLSSRRILRRIGYGKYQLEDGRIVDGLP